jgi:hypothetical protein
VILWVRFQLKIMEKVKNKETEVCLGSGQPKDKNPTSYVGSP